MTSPALWSPASRLQYFLSVVKNNNQDRLQVRPSCQRGETLQDTAPGWDLAALLVLALRNLEVCQVVRCKRSLIPFTVVALIMRHSGDNELELDCQCSSAELGWLTLWICIVFLSLVGCFITSMIWLDLPPCSFQVLGEVQSTQYVTGPFVKGINQVAGICIWSITFNSEGEVYSRDASAAADSCSQLPDMPTSNSSKVGFTDSPSDSPLQIVTQFVDVASPRTRQFWLNTFLVFVGISASIILIGIGWGLCRTCIRCMKICSLAFQQRWNFVAPVDGRVLVDAPCKQVELSMDRDNIDDQNFGDDDQWP